MGIVKIGVMGGVGHIGLVQAACLAKLGYKTIAYDIDTEKIKGILKDKMPIEEQGLRELVREGMAVKLLEFTSKIVDLQEADIIFICVGTPSLPNGEADVSQVYSAVERIAKNRSKNCIVVMKSTVPLGTSRNLTKFLKEKNLENKITIVSNPEFLREGSGVKDFLEPSRIVVGSEIKEASEKVARLYALQEVPMIITTWENAELIKLASNAFLSTKISFINEIGRLCEKVGADIRIISKGIGLDPRINPYFIEGGVGFSGPCLEKDLKSLISEFPKVQQESAILKAALKVNEGQRSGIVEKLKEELEDLKGKEIAVLGMAFKEGTDDVRDSHSLPIIRHLLSEGVVVTVTDPWIKGPEYGRISKGDLPNVQWASSPYEAVKNKDAIIILTAWKEYRELDIDRIRDIMKNPLIIDGRNLFQVKDMKAKKTHYRGMGI